MTAAALAATVWAMRNPSCGIREPEEIPHVRASRPGPAAPSSCAAPLTILADSAFVFALQNEILDVMAPYIAPVVGEFTDWTPLEGRETLFKEDIDREDPWQFKNVLVE